MFSTILKLKATNSRLGKESILRGLSPKDKELFKKLAKATYSSNIKYHIKKVILPKSFKDDGLTLDEVIDFLLENIASRKLTGHAARDAIINMCGNTSSDNAQIVLRILKRNLDCGVNARTINKIFPQTIYLHPYHRCLSFSEKNISNISLPCFSQTKEDGMYVDIISNYLDFKIMSRNGETLTINKNPQLKHGFVYQGEALVLDENGVVMPREEGNGYLNSDNIDPDRVFFKLWDMVPLQLWLKEADLQDPYHQYSKQPVELLPYSERLTNLEHLLKNTGDDFQLIDSIMCSTVEDIFNHFIEHRDKGLEGTIIKDKTLGWKNGESKHQVKCKIIFECELEIIGLKPGNGKHEGKLGSFECKSSCGKLVTNVSGLTDLQRTLFNDPDKMIGEIITVKANDVQEKGDTASLFLPRLVEVRWDKTEADNLERIYKQLEAAKNLLLEIGN